MRKTTTVSIHSIIWLLTAILFSSFIILETSTNGSRILLLITALILGLSFISDGKKICLKIGMFQKMQIPFILFCFASMLWAYNKSYALEKGITLVEIMICMTVLYSYYSGLESIDPLLKVVMYSGFFTTVYSYFYYGISNIYQIIIAGDRIPSAFTNTNTLGMLAAIASVIAVYYIFIQKQKWLVVLIIPAVILVAASGSRKALILLVVGSTLVAMKNSKSHSLVKRTAYGLLVLVGVFILLYFLSRLSLFAGINQRMEGMINLITQGGEIDSSAQLRQNYIMMGMRQFSKTPFLGIGIGCPRILTNAYYGHDAYLHNNYVELLCGGGVVGFLLYYLNYLYLIINIVKYRKQEVKESVVALALIVALLLTDYGSVSYYAKATYFYFMIFYILVERLKSCK